MKMKRFLLSCLLTLVMVLNLTIVAFASSEIPDAKQTEARTIALNSPAVFGYQAEWDVVQETVLYNLKDEVVGYCFDMKNISESDAPATTYAIINANEKDFPLMLFGADGTSAYYERSYEKAYYFGTLDFYVEENDEIVNARTNEELSDSEAASFSNVRTRTLSKDYSSIRRSYLNGIVSRAVTAANQLSNVPSLQWRKGCAPTSIAMLIKARYPALDGNTLIDNLAVYMETTSGGSTPFAKITSGTNTYFNSTSLTSPAIYGWNSPKDTGIPRTGLTYNTTADFKSSIDSGFPVGVYCNNSNVTTPGYPNGIGAHMMAGIGYSFSTSGNFVTCYTTSVRDGAVSFPITTDGLNMHAWFWLKW